VREQAPVTLAVVALVALAAPVHAQPAERTHDRFIGRDVLVLEVDDCRPRAPDSEEHRRQEASEHFRRGGVLYSQGDYHGAVEELVAAYCTVPYYAVLKDIGQAYERELEYEKAIAYLERFVREVPTDARPADSCQPDPQDEKRNVLARIQVLSRLKAKIRVDTSPPDAQITLANAAGVAQGSKPAGQELEVQGGTYEMTIERKGFHTEHREITAEIGKPYTYFIKLDPLLGHVHVRVVPSDAKLYLDKQPMGTGRFDAALEGRRYTLYAEAADRVSVTREIEVVPDRDAPEIAFELPARPEYGRKQLIGYGTAAAGTASALLSGVQTNRFYSGLAAGGGLIGGFLGFYYATPDDLELGASSLTITSSLGGGVAGGAVVAAITNQLDPTLVPPAVGGGLVLGAAAGYYVGRRTRLTAGDAAVINSGAVWGTVSSSLFALSFNASNQISGGIVLAGLGAGTLGGVLLQRYVTVSRPHAALVDAGGVVGIVVGLATLSVVSRADNGSVRNDERSSNYALGGLAVGLLVGGILTRHIDEPSLQVTPVLTKTTSAHGASTTVIGVTGQF
jgi:tetratricopeptide (TPR) repeat protein